MPTTGQFSADSYLQGTVNGHAAADDVSTSSRFIGGVAGGFFLGLIGTVVVYVVAGSDHVELPAEAVLDLSGRDQAYVQGFEAGYSERVRSRRRSSALGGGLVGNALLLVVLLGAYQQ